MKTEIINDIEKVITAENNKVLTNGGDFEIYPKELICNINDNSWFEIDEPIIELNSNLINLNNI